VISTVTVPIASPRQVEALPLSGHRTAIATALTRYAALLERRIAADRLALVKVRFAIAQMGGDRPVVTPDDGLPGYPSRLRGWMVVPVLREGSLPAPARHPRGLPRRDVRGLRCQRLGLPPLRRR
jgi:hypothetical protein